MNINNKLFDVIIIGSGPAGISAAWPLVVSGVRVLMIDGGKIHTPEISPYRPRLFDLRNGKGAKFLVGSNMSGLRDVGFASPKLRTAVDSGFDGNYILNNHIKTVNFHLVGTLSPGGLSRIWGGVCCTYDDSDLKGSGLCASDLELSYKNVANRIGISGVLGGNMEPFLGAGLPLQSPLPLTPLAQDLLDKSVYSKGFQIGQPHVAVLTSPKGDRAACSEDLACMWGCRNNAVYSSEREIPELLKFINFNYIEGVIADKVYKNEGEWIIEGNSSENKSTVSLCTNKIIFAAGTFATTSLVLRNLKKDYTSLPIKTNPAFSAAFIMPFRLGHDLPKSGYGNSQLCFRIDLSEGENSYVFGLVYDAASMPASDLARHMPLTSVSAMNLTSCLLSSIAIVLVYFPSSYSNSTAEMQADGKILIKGGFNQRFDAEYKHVIKRLKKYFFSLVAIMLPRSAKIYEPGAEVHYGGTLAAAGLIGKNGDLIGESGIYVVDGAALACLPAKSNTFTIMANADRIGNLLKNNC